MAPDMRLALITPPSIRCTGPPLGIACLQAYLAEKTPQVEVGLFDLNLALTDRVLSRMAQGEALFEVKSGDTTLGPLEIARAADVMRGSPGAESYTDRAVYQNAARIYLAYEEALRLRSELAASRMLAGLDEDQLWKDLLLSLLAPVLEFNPHAAGLSILLPRQIWPALLLARELKDGGAVVIFGGAALTAKPRPQALLAEKIPAPRAGKDVQIASAPLLDYIIVGEGELGIEGFLQNFDHDRTATPGLIYRQNRETVCNPAEAIPDLDTLPAPDFQGLAMADYHSPRLMLPYISARGCFWGKCAFCIHHKTYLAYREQSLGHTLDHLEQLKQKYQTPYITFNDEMFSARRFRGLSRGIMDRGLDILYSAYGKPTEAYDAPLMEQMQRSGLRLLQWGVESGSQPVLDLMKKGIKAKVVQRVLRLAHEAGIWNLAFMIFGLPGETDEDWARSEEFIRRNSKYINVLLLSPFLLEEGTDIVDDPQAYGLSDLKAQPPAYPISNIYDYQARTGNSKARMQELYKDVRPRIEAMCEAPPSIYRLRDHLLLLACLD